MDLEFATFEQINDELKRRYSGHVLIVCREGKTIEDRGEVHMDYAGGFLNAVGLLDAALADMRHEWVMNRTHMETGDGD